MDKKVLATYGSKLGSTAEIAEKIGEIIRQKGLQADVLDAGTVKDLTPYNKIIVGSSLYMGQWNKKAVSFLKKNMGMLAKLPVWCFVSGPTGPGNPVELLDGRLYPKSLQPVIEEIKPHGITCFGGKLAIDKLGPFEKWIIKKVKAPDGDFRDWEAIAAWTDTILEESCT